MAVQFLTGLNVNGNININTNQLQNVVIQPLAADPAGIDGRIYYNSGTNKLKIYNGTDWVAFQTGNDQVVTYDLTGVGSTNGTAGVRLTGSDASVDDVLVVGAGTTTVTRSGNTLTVASIGSGYTLPVSAGGSNSAVVTLDASTGTDSTVTISGTAGEIEITETIVSGTEGTVFIGLPDDVTIGNDLTVTNDLTVLAAGAFTGQVTIPLVPGADADAASKRYVDQSNIGQSVFQGGYNAATNTPDLDTAPSNLIKKGWFWAVTVTGDFFTETVQPGDLIYADQDNPGATFGNWVVVQSGQDIATAGAQASAIRGISAYDSANFSVDASGWVTLNPQGNANGRRVDLNSASLAYVTRAETGTSPNIVTTFTVDIRNVALFGTAADASRVKVETTDRIAPFGTVYPDVSRSGSGTVIVAMNDVVADNTYSLLLNYV